MKIDYTRETAARNSRVGSCDARAHSRRRRKFVDNHSGACGKVRFLWISRMKPEESQDPVSCVSTRRLRLRVPRDGFPTPVSQIAPILKPS
jgi:hypothetical protein